MCENSDALFACRYFCLGFLELKSNSAGDHYSLRILNSRTFSRSLLSVDGLKRARGLFDRWER